MITTVIATLILLLAVGGAVRYIIKAKKRGVKCIGCPAAESCSSCHNAQKLEEEIRNNMKTP